LLQLHGESVDLQVHELASNHWRNDEHNEDDEQEEVQNGITNRATSAELRLLERVNRRTDLATVNFVSNVLKSEVKKKTYLGRSQKSMTEWNVSM
jgi:hypothetical protein